MNFAPRRGGVNAAGPHGSHGDTENGGRTTSSSANQRRAPFRRGGEVDGEAVEEQRLRITAGQWREHRGAAAVQLVGVAACRPLFGLPD